MTNCKGCAARDEVIARVRALAEEWEAWEWSAPVGPGNASYANGYENGRRSVARELLAALPAPQPDAEPAHLRADGACEWHGDAKPCLTCSSTPPTTDAAFGPALATADDVIAGHARYADTPGGHADRRTLAEEREKAISPTTDAEEATEA